MLLFDSTTCIASSIYNIVNYGPSQAFTAVLWFVVGIVNLFAFIDLGAELRRLKGRSALDGCRKPREFLTVVVGQASAIPLFLLPLSVEWNSRIHDGVDIAVCIVVIAQCAAAAAVTLAALIVRPRVPQRGRPPSANRIPVRRLDSSA
ncbi:hypothetical protein [Wenjunlia tyrosinilytica]|uniref:hypothetical protein n=1 Tax=Wenjunlia tyrosinilytica TaxID=1544741 RepID=UPI00166C5CC0|nr:hypothetical protein [Wenjunlia tyrosinilytica]